jgi:hypothetical protein
MSRSQRPLLSPLFALVFSACVSEAVLPGDVVVGLFRFHAQSPEPSDGGSTNPDMSRLTDGGFDFEGTFSRESVDGGAWITVDGFSRVATYDTVTQRYVSTQRSSAPVPSCGEACQGAEIEETLSVVVLSDSQSQSIGDQCEKLASDGGLPDGSVPGPTVNGYDAEKACGDLWVTFIPGTRGTCTCEKPYTARYGVEGERRFNGGK